MDVNLHSPENRGNEEKEKIKKSFKKVVDTYFFIHFWICSMLVISFNLKVLAADFLSIAM